MIAGLIKAKRNYNPSLVSTGEGFLMAYRSEPEDFTVSEIVLAELDSEMKVLRNQRLKIPGAPAGRSFEDPRLFWFGGELHIAFSEAQYGLEKGWKSVQVYGKLKKGKNWTLPKVWYPKYGANDWTSKEKNWTFFEAEGALRCVYDMNAAGWVVLELEGDEVVQEWRHPAIEWNWGRMSGGTPAVRWGDRMLTVFHSWEGHKSRGRLYHMAFATFEAEAPHAPILMSARPIMSAQTRWGFPEGERWAPLCIFPGGLEIEGRDAIVAYGRNDLSMAIERFRVDGLVPMRQRKFSGGERRVRLIGNVMVGGRPAFAGTEVVLRRFTADSLITRGKAVAL
jgi:predicted GH43/DUF377 family glycosyl hydrolase